MKPVVIDNFISKIEALILVDYFRGMTPDIRNQIGFHWGTTNKEYSQPITKRLIDKIQKSMEEHFKLNLLLKRCLMQTIYKGGEVGAHWDNYYAEKEDGYSQNVYSAILYLSDDYLGGEIKFSYLDIELKPDPGTLVYFPGTKEFEHGVNTVLSGERTNFILFFNNV
jgi:hypothetical protein